MSRKRKYKYQSGFTLIEAMAAAIVFTIGSLGLLSLMLYSAEANRTSRDILIATTLAKSKVAEFEGTAYNDIASGKEANNLKSDGLLSASAYESKDGTFVRFWNVTEVSLSHGTYKKIEVTVRWFDRQANSNQGHGKWRSVTITGAISK